MADENSEGIDLNTLRKDQLIKLVDDAHDLQAKMRENSNGFLALACEQMTLMKDVLAKGNIAAATAVLTNHDLAIKKWVENANDLLKQSIVHFSSIVGDRPSDATQN